MATCPLQNIISKLQGSALGTKLEGLVQKAQAPAAKRKYTDFATLLGVGGTQRQTESRLNKSTISISSITRDTAEKLIKACKE